MPERRGDPLWKSLAVAFGDGLVFAAGVRLAQRAAQRREVAGSDATSATLPAAPPTVDHRVVEAVARAIEEQVAERAAQVERRIADLEAQFAGQLAALAKQDEAAFSSIEKIGARCDARLAALRAEWDAEVMALQESQQAAANNAPRELLLTIGQVCLDAAGQAKRPEPVPLPGRSDATSRG